MKKFIIIAVFIFTCSLHSNAQEKNSISASISLNALAVSSPVNSGFMNLDTKDNAQKDYDYYMRKRKNQKTIGWSLLGGGFLFSGVGLLLANSNSNKTDYNHTAGKGAVVCVIVGAAAGLASIPFMIMAGNNRNKAKLLLETQKTGYGIPLKTGNIAGLTVSVPITRK